MNEPVPTSIPHRAFALIGTSFVCFQFYYLIFYANNFWFSWEISWIGIPVTLVAIATAHFLLLFLQSKTACRSFRWIFKGRPPMLYTRWIYLSDDGFWYGLRHVRFSVVDELGLTFFGNLLIRTRAIGGPELDEADLIMKLPFSAASQPSQNLLIEKIKAVRPDVILGKVLLKALDNKILKGQAFVQTFGAAIMILLLLDVGQSLFYALKVQKHYHLARVAAIEGKTAEAEQHMRDGDYLFAHPFPLSYVTTRIFTVRGSANGFHELKAEALWLLGKKDEALVELKKAQEADPEDFRTYLMMARLLAEQGKTEEALAKAKLASEKHKHSLLTGLYEIAIVHDGKPEEQLKTYEAVAKKFNEEGFGEEPRWPPGGHSYLADNFYSVDVYFIIDKLLGKKEKTSTLLHYPEESEKTEAK
jgi:tetratricopeptide (TPR) repeat protein